MWPDRVSNLGSLAQSQTGYRLRYAARLFRMAKLSIFENSRWPLILKIAKPKKSAFSQEWLGSFD